jgi:hypothetical protein
MQENVVIQFNADIAGLVPAIDILQRIGQVSKEDADAAKKMAAEWNRQQADIAAGLSRGQTGIEKFANAFKNLAGSIGGGAINQTFADIMQSMQRLDPETAKLITEFQSFGDAQAFAQQAAGVLRQQLLQLAAAGKADTDEYKNLQTAIRELDAGMQQLGDSTEADGRRKKENDEKTKSLRSRMRELREEMAKVAESLGTNSDEYHRLQAEAGELQDRIGDMSDEIRGAASDTPGLDALSKTLTGAVGGFTAVQSSIALFGGDMEALQETFYKVQAAQQVLNGVTQVALTLNKSTGIAVSLRTVATNLQTAAQGKNIVITKLATAAQKILNRTAAANPYLLLAMALLAVGAALAAFILFSDKAAKKQIEANELEKTRIEQLNRQSQAYRETADAQDKAMGHEIDMLKAKGASEAEVAKKENERLQKRIEAAAKQSGLAAEEIENLEKNRAKVEELQKALDDMNDAKTRGDKKTEITIDGRIRKVKVNDEDVQKAIQGSLDNFTAKVKIATETSEAEDAAKKELERKEAEDAAKRREKAKAYAVSEARAAAEVRLLEARKGTREELAARIKAIETQQRLDLANAELTASERKKIALKAEQDIADAKKAFRDAQLNDEKAYWEALVIEAKEGSEDEMNARVELLEKQREAELNRENITANQKRLINAKYQKDIDTLVREYHQKRSASELNAEISRINAELSAVKKGTVAEMNLQIEKIDRQLEIERKAAQESISDKKEMEARITEIEADAERQRKELRDGMREKEIDEETRLAARKVELSRQEAEKAGKFNESTHKGREARRQFELDSIQVETDALNKKYEAGLISESEYQTALSALQDERFAVALEKQKEHEEAVKELKQQAFDFAMSLVNTMFDAQKERLQQQLDDLDHYYTTDAEEAAKNSSLKLISEEELARRQLEIKRKQAQTEKAQAIFTALINAAVGVTKALSSAPPPVNIALAAVTAAAAAVQIAAISSKPLPKYAKGRKGGAGEMAWVGEHGAEMMWIPGGASIIPASKSAKLNEAMKIAAEYRLPAMSKMFVPDISIPDGIRFAGSDTSLDIDYNRLGQAVGQNMPEIKQLNLSVDETGFNKYIFKGNWKRGGLNAKIAS